jgi:leucyl aminopeptidase
MAAEAQKIADNCPLIKEVRMLKGKELPEHGMNLFWNVGKGAACLPVCVMVNYKGRDDTDEVDFAIVGKGVTYDTGGLNIKLQMMEMMYQDKGGSCAVLGALQGCIELKLKKNIVFACAFADNAIGPDAFKPNDILTAMNGLTVEIGNTDAEGRLVLADTMTYVQRHFKPKKVCYIATLTGSSIVALGKTTAGVYSTHDDMVAALKKASDESFEPIWHMPLNDEHRDAMKGRYSADLNNLGDSPYGGSC